ncbi:MAG: CAP domain-containing protein [Betaproteobacteria bacterium]
MPDRVCTLAHVKARKGAWPLCCRVLAVAIGVVGSAAAADNDADYSQRLATLLNHYRASLGRPALAVDATIAGLARDHSAAMAKAGQLHHDDFPSRVRRSGFALCVENVGWNYRSPEGQFEGWRGSPGHDRNMLDPRVDRVGIGVVGGYATMIACGK